MYMGKTERFVALKAWSEVTVHTHPPNLPLKCLGTEEAEHWELCPTQEIWGLAPSGRRGGAGTRAETENTA